MPVLQGGQGIKKSEALATLVGKEFFSDNMANLHDKDALLEVHRIWIMEIAELAGIRKTQVEGVKAFISRRNDFFRAPYDRRVQEHLRAFVFAGTTNDDTPFTDETGNRRYWPVKCGNIDLKKLAADRDQIWAEAVALYKNGKNWWLDAETEKLAAEEQDRRYQTGQWDELIEPWLENPTQATKKEWHYDRQENTKFPVDVPVEPWNSDKDKVTVSDVLRHCIGKPQDHWTQPDKNAVAKCLTHNGWRPHPGRIEGKSARFYLRPEGR